MFGFGKPQALPEIDSEQRWLVRFKNLSKLELKLARKGHSDHHEVGDITIGEVSGTGEWFRLKEAYRPKWHHISEYEWLEQLV